MKKFTRKILKCRSMFQENLRETDNTVPLKLQKGITLIALVITIIVLLILAGVTLSIVFNRGIINKSQQSVDTYSEQSAREKLEIELVNMLAEKVTNNKYNKDDFLTKKLFEAGFSVNGDIVIVDGWQFEIDRNVPKIINSLGKGTKNEDIKIELSQEVSNDYTTSTVTVKITYNGELKEININGEKINSIPKAVDGIYTITKKIKENKTVGILVKDAEDNYNISNISVVDLTEDMIIDSAEKLAQFRNMVNTEGRTFENRTVTVTKDIDLSSICYKVDGTVTNDKSWEPIGATGTIFAGTFDGGYHNISNLYINSNQYADETFFSETKDSSIIKNMIFKQAYIKNTFTSSSVNAGTAVVVGWNYGTIQNCLVSGNVVYNSNNDYYPSVGGVVAFNRENGSIENCINTADINSVAKAQTYVGGIAGNNKGNVENCYNIGDIIGQSSSANVYGGGIVGFNYTTNSSILNCYNIGLSSVSSSKTTSFIGGIVGGNGSSASSKGNITNSYCIKNTDLAYNYYNGSKNVAVSDNRLDNDVLMGYASTLGDAFTSDEEDKDGKWIYNNGYPILKWQKEHNVVNK